MQLKSKKIEFVKDGEKRQMTVFYVELVINGKMYEVQLELYRKNNFIRSLLENELNKKNELNK